MYSVEQMCAAGCTSRRGIRFWEERGLFGDVARTSGNQRKFTEEQYRSAKIIAAAQFAGFEISQIKEMIAAYDEEAFAAITYKLAAQMNTILTLTENLPAPVRSAAPAVEWDL